MLHKKKGWGMNEDVDDRNMYTQDCAASEKHGPFNPASSVEIRGEGELTSRIECQEWEEY
jgi:hypothetical protein